ncbi:Nodule Cysteine-Rich (NCR) secreted peptide [Medicago truncatula]|uniref:Nodule Cysteine-Rich (NCR) secreted peptide n=2 Tax=Medicago truncatula TaxID=3880 RepID=A0A072VHC4_MEDTR|nr:Nodule Cysteine-Rich (NCR) secreted peptide [Medicago truncatula]
MKKMADIFKFVYDMIFFVSVFLIVVYGEKECISDAVCYEKYPGPFNFIMNCVDGYCKAFPKLV